LGHRLLALTAVQLASHLSEVRWQAEPFPGVSLRSTPWLLSLQPFGLQSPPRAPELIVDDVHGFTNQDVDVATLGIRTNALPYRGLQWRVAAGLMNFAKLTRY